MMKRAIKLLVLTGALLSAGAMAQTSRTQTWNFNWPQFMVIFSSVATVNFDFEGQITDGNTTTSLPTRSYPRASNNALLECLLGSTDPDQGTGVNTVETVTEPTSNTTTCTFAPSDLDKNWDVSWQSGDSEGALITVANVTTNVRVSVDSALPGGFTLQVANAKTSTTEPSFQDISTAGANLVTGLAAGIHFIPLTFALEVDLSSAAVQSTTVTRTVTYTISAQ